MWLLLTMQTAWALELAYADVLQRAVEGNPALVQAGYDLEAASGALLAARSTFDVFLDANLNYTSSTSEDIQEFGEVNSEYQGLNYNAGLSRLFATGTNLSLNYNTTRSRFVYELVGGDITVEDDAQFASNLSATLTQSLLQGYRTTYNLQGVRTARRARNLSEVNLEIQRQQTLAEAANAYWTLYYLNRVAEISQASLEVAREEQRIVHARVQAGDLAPVERSRVDATVVQAESALIEATNNAAAAADTLLTVIGERPGQPVGLATEPAEPTNVDLDAEGVVQQAMQTNPTIIAARLQEETAELDYRDARHARLPELTATGRYTLKGFEDSFAETNSELFRGDLPEWFVGGNLSMPLGNSGDRGAYQERQAAAARARIAREAAERNVDQQVRAQVRALSSAQQAVALAEANLRLAEDTLNAERALQSAGRAIQKDVLESIQAVDDARVQLAKAKADFQVALIELERLKGTL